MRKLDVGMENQIEILVMDDPGAGGACHKYYICRADGKDNEAAGEFGFVKFQNGPIQENGVNGCQQEDLLKIVIDRLRSFQAGDFSCRENAIALTKCEEALHWLESRTRDRIKRGVEGKTEK